MVAGFSALIDPDLAAVSEGLEGEAALHVLAELVLLHIAWLRGQVKKSDA